MRNVYLSERKTWDLPVVQMDDSLNPFANRRVRLLCALPVRQPYVTLKGYAVVGLLEAARNAGILGKRLVESSSGATGLCLVHYAKAYGVGEVVLVLNEKVPPGKRWPIINAGGIVIQPQPGKSAIATARAMGGGGYQTDGTWKPAPDGTLNLDQYANPAICDFYCEAAEKIQKKLPGGFTLLACPIGTGGTITGLSRSFRTTDPDIVVVGAMCAEGESIPGMRSLSQTTEIRLPWREAIGGGKRIEVKGLAAWLAVLQIQHKTGMMVGPSSGATYIAALEAIQQYHRAGALDSLRDKDGFVTALIILHDGLRPYDDQPLPVPANWLNANAAPLPWDVLEWDDC